MCLTSGRDEHGGRDECERGVYHRRLDHLLPLPAVAEQDDGGDDAEGRQGAAAKDLGVSLTGGVPVVHGEIGCTKPHLGHVIDAYWGFIETFSLKTHKHTHTLHKQS